MAVMVRKKGKFCPKCGKGDQHPYCHRWVAPGVKVRYWKCPACKITYKSQERFETRG